MTLDELRATKRDAILAIAARHGVSGIRVFGSFARGEARNDSDLDLLIEAGPARTPFFPGGMPFCEGGLGVTSNRWTSSRWTTRVLNSTSMEYA